MEPQLGLLESSFTNRYSIWVRETLNELPDSFTITDPSISGHPIVFASRGFLKMSGYEVEEVVGKNGRVFQGPKTDRRAVLEIREAIRQERSLQVSIVNYRRDGRPFWMLFFMCPVFGKEDGRVVHFVGVQVPISRRRRQSGGGFGCVWHNNIELRWFVGAVIVFPVWKHPSRNRSLNNIWTSPLIANWF